MKEATARPWTGVEGTPRRAQDPAHPTLPPTPGAGQTRSPKLPTCSGPFPPPHSAGAQACGVFKIRHFEDARTFLFPSAKSAKRTTGKAASRPWKRNPQSLGARGSGCQPQAAGPAPAPSSPEAPALTSAHAQTPLPSGRCVPGPGWSCRSAHLSPRCPQNRAAAGAERAGDPQGVSCTAGYPGSHRPPGLVAPGWAGEGAQTTHLGAGQGCGKGTFAEAEGTGSSSRVRGPCRGLSRDGRRQGLDDRATQLWDDSRGRGRREQEEPHHGQNAGSCHPPNVPAVK